MVNKDSRLQINIKTNLSNVVHYVLYDFILILVCNIHRIVVGMSKCLTEVHRHKYESHIL